MLKAVAFLFPPFTAKVQRSPWLWGFVPLRHPPHLLESWAEGGWSWGGCWGRASEMLATCRRCTSLGARPRQQYPEQGTSEGQEGLEVLAARCLLCIWLLSLLRDEEGLRRGLNPTLVKTAGLAAGPGDVLEANAQHKVLGSKRLRQSSSGEMCQQLGRYRFPPDMSKASLWPTSPVLGHGMPSPGLFLSSHCSSLQLRLCQGLQDLSSRPLPGKDSASAF